MLYSEPLYRLHRAAETGSPEEVAELAAAVDVDEMSDGRTALWLAVQSRRPDNARVLVAAGADPWRPMMAGWSPARLSLAGPTPDLFGEARDPLSAAEVAAVAESGPLLAALDGIDYDGWSVCCVGGIDTDEAIRRLSCAELPTAPEEESEDLDVIGFTDVPGGVVVAQPWAYAAAYPLVSRLLSVGTVAYAMYANPKSGEQGSAHRDGRCLGSDLSPGSWAEADDPGEEVLRMFLYRDEGSAYACVYAGLRPSSVDAFLEPRRWGRLPERDYWAV